MPRYCAATSCRNRAGQSARDQRRLSFYPFPLHDKERLEKWLRNMRRDTWIPSKHQVLCSDHFTPDSLDVRWGIRYLKTTAVPTIFSSENQGKGLSQKNTEEKRIEDGKEQCTCTAATILTPCSPKDIIIEETLNRTTNTTLKKSPEKLLQGTVKTENYAAELDKSIRQDIERQSCVITERNGAVCNFSSSENHSFDHPGEILISSTDTISQTSELRSSLECLSDPKVTVLQATGLEHLETSLEYNTTVPINELLPDQWNSDSAGCTVEVQADENSVLLQSVSEAFEHFNGHSESVFTIFVPSADSKDPFFLEGSFITVEQKLVDTEGEKSECITTYGGTELTQIEHSYCRQDMDKEQLWQKITKLHAKIALLEVQERKTLSRLKSLETLIAKLKQENLLSEEKLKIVENCFTTFEVTMIQ